MSSVQTLPLDLNGTLFALKLVSILGVNAHPCQGNCLLWPTSSVSIDTSFGEAAFHFRIALAKLVF